MIRGRASNSGGPGRSVRVVLTALAAAFLLTACVPAPPAPTVSPSSTSTATAPDTPVPTPSAEPTPSAGPTSSPTPSPCPADWDTDAKTATNTPTGSITRIRAGRHDCYDRLVIDINDDAAGYDVRYVSAVAGEGSGEQVDLRGGAFLHLTVYAPAYDPTTGEETFSFSDATELVDVGGFDAFRQVAWAGSFEGQTAIGLGVASKLPFRVFALDGPGDGSRVVVDVAH